MIELKAFNMPRYAGEFTIHEVYLKSEADKVIAHHKYKRCVAIAKECVNGEIKLKRVKMRDMNNHQFWQFDNDYWQKWNNRWLKIFHNNNRSTAQ